MAKMSQQKKHYTQKFRKAWLQDFRLNQWIQEVPGEQTLAWCKYCRCSLKAKLRDLLAHKDTRKHKGKSDKAKNVLEVQSCNAEEIVSFVTLVPEPLDTEAIDDPDPSAEFETSTTGNLSTELRLALFVAVHCVIGPPEDFTKDCVTSFQNSGLGDHLQKRKCCAIIKNVLQPYFVERLIQDVGNMKFSLILDLLTGMSASDSLGIVIVYYSVSLRRIVSSFLSLVPLPECSAEVIVQSITDCLSDKRLEISNLQGIAMDNSSVLVDVNFATFLTLRSLLHRLVMLKCVCHSLQRAFSQAASSTLPQNLDVLVSKTHHWFDSSDRRLHHKEIFKLIGDNDEVVALATSSKLRWISISCLVEKIVNHWSQLATHFKEVHASEKCNTAELLSWMYRDDKTHAFFLFLQPVLSEVQRVNKLFECSEADSPKLLNDLMVLLHFLINRVITPSPDIDPISTPLESYVDANMYMGYRCEKKIRESTLVDSDVKQIREKCRKFMLELIAQVRQRLPEKADVLQQLHWLSVSEALKLNRPSLVPLLELMHLTEEKIEKIEGQWRNLMGVKWNDVTDSVSFWTEVANYENANGENPFADISEFAFEVLTLPFSNADVKQLFRQVRNSRADSKLSNKMLNAIFCIRAGLKRSGKCCDMFSDTPLPAGGLDSLDEGDLDDELDENLPDLYFTIHE